MTTEAGQYHLAWHQLFIPGMVAGTVALCYVLVPASTPRKLRLFTVELITDSGRPKEKLTVNPLQLVSPRDPELTVSGTDASSCLREKALVARLLERAHDAAFVLPEIVATSCPPPWSRLSIPEFDRQTLWRAGGAL